MYNRQVHEVGRGALLAGMRPRDALKVGVGMMPRMEVALIIASIGVSSGAVRPQLFSNRPSGGHEPSYTFPS